MRKIGTVGRRFNRFGFWNFGDKSQSNLIKVKVVNNRLSNHAMLPTFLISDPRSLVNKIDFQAILIKKTWMWLQFQNLGLLPTCLKNYWVLRAIPCFPNAKPLVVVEVLHCTLETGPLYPLTGISVPDHLECLWVKVTPLRLPWRCVFPAPITTPG